MVALDRQWAEEVFSESTVRAMRAGTGAALPFSFVYGGRHSSSLVGDWECQVQDEAIDATQLRRTLTLTDPQTGLEVRAVATIYTDTPGVDWTLYFRNNGRQDTPILEQVLALDVTIRPAIEGTPVLHRLRGSACAVDDWLPVDDPLPPESKIAFAPRDGRSSKGACPFFDVQWGDGGVITAIGWSGQWQALVEHRQDRGLRIQAGMQEMHLTLRPGETLRSPRILQLYWAGMEHVQAYNLFRRTMLNHVLPKVDGRPVTPPIVHLSTAFYELNDSTEENVLSHLESTKGLGFEFFWLDAYWTRDGFPRGMGHYGFPLQRAEPADRFPRGLRPISEAAHRAGMGFVVWFEPELTTAPAAGCGWTWRPARVRFRSGVPTPPSAR